MEAVSINLKVGDVLNIEEQLLAICSDGLCHVRKWLSAPGEFSVRGGIIDIYPLTETNPIRIELFDTEIDSIRTFSLEINVLLEKLNMKLLLGQQQKLF